MLAMSKQGEVWWSLPNQNKCTHLQFLEQNNKVTDHSLRNITQNGNEQTDEQTSKAKNERMNDLTFLPSF